MEELKNWYLDKKKNFFVPLTVEHAEDYDGELQYIMQVTDQSNPKVEEAIAKFTTNSRWNILNEINKIKEYLKSNFTPYVQDGKFICKIKYTNSDNMLIYLEGQNDPTAYLAKKGSTLKTAFAVKINNVEQLQNIILSTGYYKEDVKEKQ